MRKPVVTSVTALTALTVLAALAAFAAFAASPPSQPPSARFADLSDGRTMRLDVFHTGGKGTEVFAVDRIVDDGAWAGSRTRLLDDAHLGAYRYEVRDGATQAPLFSRGYSSLYSEWETTAESKNVHRTFHESLRFPWPKRPVEVVLFRRDRTNAFVEIWRTTVDPASIEVNAAPPSGPGKPWTLFENGPSATKVDLLFLGDGYAEKEIPKFHSDVERMASVLFTVEPYEGRRNDFNVRAVDLPARESGVLRSQSKQYRRSPLSVQYGVFGTERYALTFDNRALREVASLVPYDALVVLVNEARYGGGAIYGDQAVVTVDTGFADYVFVHELGHHFAGLADEYYTMDVAYETGNRKLPEPWEPNATALHDPASLKWRDLVEPGTPLPTPWEKEPFEERSRAYQAERKKRLAEGATPADIDELFRRQKVVETKALSSMRWSGKTGAFEGASYEARGLYRPSADCIMFTRDEVGFCPVCRRAIERRIDDETRP
jgi:hypothetical protein